MEDRDLFYAKEYHSRLVAISDQERALRDLRPARPGLRDIALLHLGDSLISLGQRIRCASCYDQKAELSQECA